MIDRDRFYFRTFCIVFWVISCIGFVTQELLPFLEQPLYRPVQLLGDVVLMWLGLATLRNSRQKWLIGILTGLVVLSTFFVNRLSLLVTINGYRDYIPLLFSLPIVTYFYTSRYSNEFRESFDRQLRIFLVLQAICVTEQFIRYGANDHGGGTIGNGGSGMISMMIILISFYFVVRNWNPDRYLNSLWRNRFYIVLLFPVFLNETKISFVLLALYFALLYRWDLRSVGKVMIALPFMALISIMLFYAYLSATEQDEGVATSEFIDSYLSGGSDSDDIIELAHDIGDFRELYDEEWGYVDLPRFLKIGLVPGIVSEDSNGGNLLGAGAGHFKGGTFLDLTPFARNNDWFITGTIPLFVFFWMSLGAAGLLWFIVWIVDIISLRNSNGWAGARIKIFAGILFLAMLCYNDALRFTPVPEVVYFIVLASYKTFKQRSLNIIHGKQSDSVSARQ